MSRSIALLLVLAVAACGGDGDGENTGGIGRVDSTSLVTIVTADQPSVLDPHSTSNGGDVKVIHQIYETLIRVDPSDVNRMVPALATQWTVADDGLSIQFQLREGVTFHDGAAFDAAAAKLSLDRLREDGFELSRAPYKPEFGDVAGFDADGHTLTMRLSSPVARVALRNLTMFCASIVSPTVLEASKSMDPDAATAFVTDNAAGTGGYRVDAFDQKAKIARLVANDDYWNGKPSIGTLIFTPVSDESTRTEYLGNPNGHFLVDDVPRQHWATVESSERMQLHSWWALNLCYLGMNAKHEATKELGVRRAIQLAVDREAVMAHYEGTARPTYSLVAQPMAEYDRGLRVPDWDDDHAKRLATATKLIDEAGAKGREITIYYPQMPRPYLPRPQNIADTVRQSLKAIGLDARIQGEENSVLFSQVSTGQYELILIGWMTDNGDPDNFYSPLADGADGKPAENNTSRTFHADVHAKLLAARQLSSAGERVTAYRDVERALQTDVAGYTPLVNTKQAVAYSKGIKGFVIDGIGHYRFDEATLE